MNRYGIVFHIHRADGVKRMGGTMTMFFDDVIDSKDDPRFYDHAAKTLKRHLDLDPTSVLTICAAYHRIDDGCIPWIPPTDRKLN